MSIVNNSYVRMIFNEQDINKYEKLFLQEIEKEHQKLNAFITLSKERIKTVQEFNENNQFKILGSTHKNGKSKEILLIVRYIDGSQRDERYNFDKIDDMRSKLSELKVQYKDVDWSSFIEEIK